MARLFNCQLQIVIHNSKKRQCLKNKQRSAVARVYGKMWDLAQVGISLGINGDCTRLKLLWQGICPHLCA